MTNLQTHGLVPYLSQRDGKGYSFGQVGSWKTVCIVLVFCASVAVTSPAQMYTTLVTFELTDGNNPFAPLVQGLDGNLYGTTTGLDKMDTGTLFEITTAGKAKSGLTFFSENGADPKGVLVQASNGNLYGTTVGGGSGTYGDGGTVFEIIQEGSAIVSQPILYRFCSQTNCTDGSEPYAGLVQAVNGDLYGTTYEGGAGVDCTNSGGCGTIFEITTAGKLKTLYNLCSQTNCTDGRNPAAALVQATNGDFYGTTEYGGASGEGTVFKINPAGKLTTLYSFCSQPGCTDGQVVVAGLLQATDGDFYGTTEYGGANGEGTVFKINPAGKLTMLYSFCSKAKCADGANPTGGLVQANNGFLYGTTSAGGAGISCYIDGGCGTIFEITPPSESKLFTVYNFCVQESCADGANPQASLIQATDGDLYGTAYNGGNNTACSPDGCGTVFSLSGGFQPFVHTLQTSGKVGTTIIILGTNLTGATSVAFNGSAATFTVISASEINATVPAGATTGTVTVITPHRTLNSNVEFRVTPQFTGFTPNSGAVGTVVTVTGVSLTQTTRVTFGGVKATAFTVDSDTQVTATVPGGAQTGKIEITTPRGTASSTTDFTVTENL
jgi:uncharacterized repeat protein (TIGR03803 family)